MRDHLRRAETTPGGYEIRYEVQSRYARCVTDEMPEGKEDEKPYTLCPRCREKVEPSDEGVHYAVELEDMPGFGQGHDYVEGRGGFYHERCPILPGWRQKPKP